MTTKNKCVFTNGINLPNYFKNIVKSSGTSYLDMTKELIDNAIDAKATELLVKFISTKETRSSKPASLEFIDDGIERDDLQGIDPAAVQSQLDRLKNTKSARDSKIIKSALSSLENAAKTNENLMPHIVHAVKHYATLGEIADILRSEFGEYQ